MTRRGFIQVLGVGAGVAVATSARADRIRVLPEVGSGEPAVAGDRVGPELQRFLDGVRVGERRAHRGLTVLWLHAPRGGAPFAIRTLDEARARGELSVTELDQAAVSGLVIDNRGPVHVLLLAGEILLGGKQHRIVVEDVLVPPRSGPLTLPVYAARAAAPSSTGSYQAIHDKPEVQAHQKDVEGALDLRTVAAHALETYGRSVHDKADERRLRVMLDDLLRAAMGAAGRVRRGLGVGRLVEFRVDRRRGSAFVAEGQVVHVAIL
jgi:ARG and Rhodanese-Phosphatase-superfamily-associated Protein domain